MTEQRKVIIFQLDDKEVWISSSASFDNHRDNFQEAMGKLDILAKGLEIWSHKREGDKTVVVETRGAWSDIEDKILEALLPGVTGVESDIEVYDRGAAEPRRRYMIRTNSHAESMERVLTEVAMAHT